MANHANLKRIKFLMNVKALVNMQIVFLINKIHNNATIEKLADISAQQFTLLTIFSRMNPNVSIMIANKSTSCG